MKTLFITMACVSVLFAGCSQAQNSSTPIDTLKTEKNQSTTVIDNPENWNKLTAEETNVIVNKGTEYPGSGVYVDNHADGTYLCKRCNNPLFESDTKFDSGTGWPSFDNFIDGSVEIIKDADGFREEIVCNNCKGHLGHVFYNEGFTDKETRHCVNSVSLKFIEKK